VSAARHLLTSVQTDPEFKILCNLCGLPKIAATEFAPSQRKKKRPACLLCKPPKSKFSNRPVDGSASGREAKRLALLRTWEAAGAIRDLRTQVPFVLIPSQYDERGKLLERPVKYIADAVYVDVFTGVEIVEDAKGDRTYAYVLKRKMMLWFHHVRVLEV
jgi:hypothetical protein